MKNFPNAKAAEILSELSHQFDALVDSAEDELSITSNMQTARLIIKALLKDG